MSGRDETTRRTLGLLDTFDNDMAASVQTLHEVSDTLIADTDRLS